MTFVGDVPAREPRLRVDARKATVGEFLRVPYIITAWSEQRPDGTWVRHAEHPELPDCSAEAESIVDALARLDLRRFEVLLEVLVDGRTPPITRPLLGATQARRRLESAGLAERVDVVWDLEASQLRELRLAQT